MDSIKKENGDFTIEFLSMIYRMRKRLIVIAFAALLISLGIFKLFFIHHTSSVTFLIDNTDPAQVSASETEEFALNQLKELSNNRMVALLFSDEMVNRLEAEIEIGQHFHLDKNNPNFIRDALSMLQAKISITRGASNTMKIEVTDGNMEFAALLANSVYNNLVQINRQVIINNLKYKKGVYNLNLNQWKSQTQQDAESFRHAVNQLQTKRKSSLEDPDEMYVIKRDLLNLFAQFDKSTFEQARFDSKYQYTSSALSDSTLQRLFLINRAYPQENYLSYVSSFFWSVCIGICAAIYYSIMVFLLQKAKHNLHFIVSPHSNGVPKPPLYKLGAEKSYDENYKV